MNDQATLSKQWQSLAQQTARKVNLGWWLERLTPALIGAGLLTFVIILILRNQGRVMSLEQIWPWLVGGIIALLTLSFVLGKKRFITRDQALVRLEAQLRLNNALSVANVGRGLWPEMPNQLSDGWQWRWPQLAMPWVAGLGSIALALWLPLASDVQATNTPAMEPQAWQQMEEWLDKLEEEKLLTPEEKEEQMAKISDLREQAPEKWFSHDSLHASDTLKEQLQRDMAKIAQNLSTLERSMNLLKNHSDKLSQAAKEQLLKDFDEALKELQNSPMDIHPDLLKELAQIDPKNMPAMSNEQMQKLRDAMKQGAKGLKEMAQQNPGFLGDGEGEEDELAEMLGELGQGRGGEGQEGEGEEGDQPGKGGVNRGPGSAPLSLAPNENDFGTQKNEAVSNSNLDHAQASTMLNIKDGKHEVDKTYNGPTSTGSAQEGKGGEQVWRDTLTPEEKAVLKRVFK